MTSKDKPGKETHTSVVFIAIFILLAAGIVISGYLYYRNYEKLYRTEVERQLSVIAELKADELTAWRNERLADGYIIFRNTAFSVLVRRYFENPADADAQSKLHAWIDKYRMYFDYDRIRLLDAQGVSRLSVPGDLAPVALSISQKISETPRSGEVTFQDFYRNEYDPEIHLAVLVPIFGDDGDSRAIGVLALRIDPTRYLYPLISRWPTPSHTAETLLIRKDGNDVLYLNELRFRKNTALGLRIPLRGIEMPVVKAVLGQEGIMEGIDYQGLPEFVAARAVLGSPWFIIARMNASEVYGPLRERLWMMGLVIIALLISAGMGLGFVWRQRSMRFYREQYLAADSLRTSLHEKELLLKELYHRTRNNMQVIIGFLSLQSQRITDEAVLDMFRDTINRIKSMALVHQKLYQAKNLSRIDLGDYIRDLVGMIVKSHARKPGAISFQMDLEGISVLIDVAVPCGLILNELISNALKHAFPGERDGKIRIELRRNADAEIEIGVEDNGVGLPEDSDIRKCESLGLESVLHLAEHQLRGRAEVLRMESGTRFRIRFREPEYKERVCNS